MFTVTHLGHHGWLLASDKARILIDPLLGNEYSPGFSAVIHPPRTIDAAKLPPIDAVILSHEHADHVSFPSLALLDRKIPIALPARSAQAIRTVIREMGFRVVDTAPGDELRVGDLIIDISGDDGEGAAIDEELTNVHILVAHRDGSFYSYGDGWPSDATLAAIGQIGVFCHVNNTIDWACLEGGVSGAPLDPLAYAARIITAESSLWTSRPPPAVTVVCGPGLAFTGGDAWMNQMLVADSERLCAALSILEPNRRFLAPRPGQTLVFERGDLRKVVQGARFVRAPAQASWPKSPRAHISLIEDFEPACGKRTIDESDWDSIVKGLDDLAGYLYGRDIFRVLVQLDRDRIGSRSARFAIVLRAGQDDDGAHVCAYDPASRRFELVDEASPIEAFAAGIEWWAADFARVLDGRMLPQRLLGHMRTWSFAPEPMSPLHSVWRFFDALNRPAAALAFYRQRISRLTAPPIVRRGGAKLRRRLV